MNILSRLLKGIVFLAVAAAFLGFFSAPGPGASSHTLAVSAFSREDSGKIPSGWKVLDFPKISRHTDYRVAEVDGSFVLVATSESSASAIYRDLDLDAAEYNTLSWRWKVDDVIKKGDARVKSGDDYAARVYVTFAYEPEKASFLEKVKYGLARAIYKLPTPGNAVNYIWANRLTKGTAIKNPYTEKAMMLAVESGPEFKGVWKTEVRNVYDDYVKLFGEKPPRITGVAVMTDTDNTGSSATAYYGDIFFRKSFQP
ncbi:MAG: DUF3047 domain-containing protein [Thermodesulfobacteriota bacterium]|nr:MAG: DUF3047 domain-containing protein [Thermodesulfobacteriota bacterium]